jgi:uncharacterized protein (TIGR02996 family)
MNEDHLLATLARNPEASALRVYADRMLEQGDVRGEFITLQLNRAERGSEPDVREEALRREVLEPALREALGATLTSCRWEKGFLADVEFEVDDSPFEALSVLVERPEAQLLRRVVLNALGWDGGGDLTPFWSSLASGPRFPRLEAVVVNVGLDLGNPHIDGPIVIGAVQPLYAAYPRLRVLELHGVLHELGEIDLPELTHFSASRLSLDAIAPLVSARWPKLEELELEFREAGGEVEPVFGPLLASPMSPFLRRVKVKSPWPDYFRAALPRTPLGRGRIVEV